MGVSVAFLLRRECTAAGREELRRERRAGREGQRHFQRKLGDGERGH